MNESADISLASQTLAELDRVEPAVDAGLSSHPSNEMSGMSANGDQADWVYGSHRSTADQSTSDSFASDSFASDRFASDRFSSGSSSAASSRAYPSSSHRPQPHPSQPHSPTMAIEQQPTPVPSIDALQRQNQDLLEWIAQLEASLGECQQALHMQMERSQAQDQLLAQRGQDLAETQDQMKRLFQELESSHQTSQRQQVLVETLTQKLAASQSQIAQLERDCTLAQQRYDEQAQHLAQAESISHDLRARLYRQQRYTLQFKAALEKCLERSHRHDQTSSESGALNGIASAESFSIETMLDELAEPSESGYPKAKPVQPWTAELDPSEMEADEFLESVPGTPAFTAPDDADITAIVQSADVQLAEMQSAGMQTVELAELPPVSTSEPNQPLQSVPSAETVTRVDSGNSDPWSLLDANTLEWTTATADVGPEVSDDIKKLLDEMLQSASELLGPELTEANLAENVSDLNVPNFNLPDAAAGTAPVSLPVTAEQPPMDNHPSLPRPGAAVEGGHGVQAPLAELQSQELQSQELQILVPQVLSVPPVFASTDVEREATQQVHPSMQSMDAPLADVIQLPTATAASADQPAATANGIMPTPPSPVIPFPGVQVQPSPAAIAEPGDLTQPPASTTSSTTSSTSGFNQPSVLSILSNVSSPSHQEAVSATADQPLPLPERSPFPEPAPPKVSPSSNSWRELLTLKTQLLANTSFGSAFSPELATAAASGASPSSLPGNDPQLVGATTPPPTEAKSASPSPLLYPTRSGKKIKSLAAIDLPSFPRKG